MHLPLFLARRFFRSNAKSSGGGTPAIWIATAGVAIGLCVMLLAVFIVKGFQGEVSRRITGFGAHIDVVDPMSFASPEAYPLTIDSTLQKTVATMPNVAHVQRFSEKIGILKTENDFQAINLKGVGADFDASFIKECLLSGEVPAFSDTASTNRLLISKTQADALGLKVGDKVYAYFFAETVKMRRFEIAGIYQTRMRQYDRTFALTDKRTVDRLNDWDSLQTGGLEVRLADFDRLEETATQMASRLNGQIDGNGGVLSVVSIKEHPRTAGVFNWLALLNTNVWLILVLVFCVAAFSMVSGLLILILERTNTIGVLKALGSSNGSLQKAFLYYAALIILRGMLIGNVLCFVLIFLQKKFGLVRLDPETYYVDAVPIAFDFWWWLAINVGTLLLTMLALLAPSGIIARIQPAKAIRFD